MVTIPAQAIQLFAPETMTSLLGGIRQKCADAPTDVTTSDNRGRIAALAYKVARTKTAIDEAGKRLVEPMKAQAKQIDEERKRARDFLDALKEQVRKPLTDYENAEKERNNRIDAELIRIKAVGDAIYATSEQAKAAAETIKLSHLFDFGPKKLDGDRILEVAKSAIETKIKQLEELERFRAEALKAERAAEESAKKARDEQIAEEARRQESERRDREERARSESQAREAQRRIDAERLRSEELLRQVEKAKQDAENAARLEREKIANEKKAEEEAKRRAESDENHRRSVIDAATNDLSEFVGVAFANLAIKAILDGKVSSVTVNF